MAAVGAAVAAFKSRSAKDDPWAIPSTTYPSTTYPGTNATGPAAPADTDHATPAETSSSPDVDLRESEAGKDTVEKAKQTKKS